MANKFKLGPISKWNNSKSEVLEYVRTTQWTTR